MERKQIIELSGVWFWGYVSDGKFEIHSTKLDRSSRPKQLTKEQIDEIIKELEVIRDELNECR
jgi:galactose-1-phosphate uridylyltransferase